MRLQANLLLTAATLAEISSFSIVTQQHRHQHTAASIRNIFGNGKGSSFISNDNNDVSGASPWSSKTKLNMAWDNKGEKSTIFDGPMAITEERDACGVGFIANTNSEGKYII